VTVPVNGLSSRTATDNWEEALIVGNGRQGALCYGGPARLLVTVSHERLFLPVLPPLDPPHTAPLLPAIRGLIRSKRPQAAADLVTHAAAEAEPGYAATRGIDPFVGAATLTCTPEPSHPGRDYTRSTDFSTGVVTQRWTTDAGPAGMAAFVSRAHDVVALRLHGPGRWALSLGSIGGRPPRPVDAAVRRRGDRITLTARFPDPPPGGLTGYTVVCQLYGPDLVLLRTVVGAPAALDSVFKGVPPNWTELLRAHAARHRDLYHRVHLDLGPVKARQTEDLLAADPGPDTVRRLFDAGRYAVISSTGDLPPVLQGVWSGTYDPPWASGYTLDGNLPAAVAALHPTGCPELMPPLFDLVESVLPHFRRNAERLYGLRGALTPVHLSTHGLQNHFGPVWCQTFWTAGAAWLARLYYDHWCYTGDRGFLAARALPFMRLAAEFHLGFVRRDDPAAAFVPSYSPENAPSNTGSQACANATMDVAAVRDLLRNLLAATAELGITDPAEPAWRDLLRALPRYRIGAGGELSEWAAPGYVDNHEHRHASHLYPLWYEPDPAIVDDPALRAAAVRTVRRRLDFWRGDRSGEMGYGLAQIGLAAAALGLADEAAETLALMATRYWRPNLVPTHNRGAIFNVDLAGGFPAVVTAMLVRSTQRVLAGPGRERPFDRSGPWPGGGAGSGAGAGPGGGPAPAGRPWSVDRVSGSGRAPRPGRLDLLPALPAAWSAGSVRGLAARGAVTVRQLSWAAGRYEAVVESCIDQDLLITVAGGEAELLSVAAGRPVRMAGPIGVQRRSSPGREDGAVDS
jgi:alpha-L-fucosidase 2